MKVRVHTAAFRKVFEDEITIGLSGTYQWNLQDKWGTPVASGLYCMRVEITGGQNTNQIMKLLVLR
jgi:hypothetical protein